MQAKFDTVTLDTPLFSIDTARHINVEAVYLNPRRIIFKNTKLYSLFKKFMDATFLVEVRGEVTTDSPKSLTQYIAEFDDNTQSVQIKSCFGKENIIGKFFLETDLDWPQAYYEKSNSFIPKYKQPTMSFSEQDLENNYGKGVPKILLGRQGIATMTDDILKLLHNFDATDQIRKVAPLIVQSYRTSPDSRFQFFKQEAFLTEIAHQLDPDLDKLDAKNKLIDEIKKSQVLMEDLLPKRPFSFKMDEISFNTLNGTHVVIDASPAFVAWLFQFAPNKPVKFANDYVIFKKSEHVVSFNKGVGTPGVEITNKGSSCFVCNNQTADLIDNTADRIKHLTGTLAQLYTLGFNKAQPLSATSPAPATQSSEEPSTSHDDVEKCVMM